MARNTPEAGITARRLAALGRGYKAGQEAAKTSREALAAGIHEAETGGWGLREIARAAGVATSTAHKLLVEETARLQLVHTNQEA